MVPFHDYAYVKSFNSGTDGTGLWTCAEPDVAVADEDEDSESNVGDDDGDYDDDEGNEDGDTDAGEVTFILRLRQ